MEKEIWDVYDRHRQQTKETINRGDPLKTGHYHLVIHVCFFNHKHQMLIQRRSLDKDGWPGLWDISIGGAVRSGESSQDAAKRESAEELGINHDFSNMLPQLTLTFERGFDDIFLVNKEIVMSDITFVDHEVCDAKWASESEIVELIHDQKFLPIHTISFIQYLFSFKL